uniref:DnaJ homolog subfamily C member 2 n=1 Tax=Meloidogyne hapla TaxID=6305 RepID=A0A1I8AZ26_MELHA
MAIAIYGFISHRRKVEPAGISYEFSIIRDKLTLGLSTWPILKNAVKPIQIEDENEDSSFEWIDEETEKYKKYLSRLDPNGAKEQDHYKILGLTKLRCEATAAQIRTAYRQKVLKYHPDKGNAGDGLRSESVFACIQKAYEQLGLSEEKRRAFDSVDPTFDETIPDSCDVNSTNFFRVLGPVFERNSSDRSHVEHFYDFWYNWKSWREFSYLDAEDKQRGEDRWERREIEKQNKAEREKRRKKDLKRISTLVEMAYSADPRIAKIKEEDKNKKQQMKERRRKERELKEQIEMEQKRQKEKDLEEEMIKKNEEEKKALQAKQQKKNLLSNQRKQLRDLASNTNYWLDGSLAAENPDRVFAISEQIERLCLCAEVDDLVNLCEKLKNICVYDDALRILRECANPEGSNNSKQSNNESTKNSIPSNDAKTPSSINAWTHTELQLLVKAVNLFPPGTQERWKQVSGYINEHSGEENNRSEKDVIKQVKQLKSGQLPQGNSSTTVPVSKNVQPATDVSVNNTNQNNDQQKVLTDKNTEDEWNAEQQRQFEKALKEIPSNDADRWDKIAAAVNGKTKKQCVRRYKKLAEMVKNAKNEAK